MKQRKPEIIFSTLTGIVTLLFMLAVLTDRELFRFYFDLFSIRFGLGVNSMELIIPLAALLTVLGMYRTLRNCLPVSNRQIALHLFLPFAVTMTIGFTLRNSSGSLSDWGLLFITGILLYLVLYFEYIACDPASVHRPLSIIVLDSLCYAVYLLFIIALRANISRQFITLPAIFGLCVVVSLKIYSFHIIGSSIPLLAAVTSAVIVFADMGLHYWPINIVSYGSLMFIWYYTFTSFVIAADREEPAANVIRRLLPAVIPSVAVFVYSIIEI